MAKHKNKHRWFMLGLLSALIAAPNATFIRSVVAETGVLQFNIYRFAAATIVTAPIVWRHRKKYRPKNIPSMIAGSLLMTVAVLSYVSALKVAPASYVTIITLLTPIIFMIYASRLTGERFDSRSLAGVSLAAAGGLVLVAGPVALKQQGNFVFYPLGTALTLINCMTFPLSIIFFAKANKRGIPMTALMGVSTATTLVCAVVLVIVTKTPVPVPQPQVAATALYSGVMVAVVARSLNIASYEHIGAVVSSSLGYLESLLAIVLPVLILGERLSREMVVGGVLILVGVFVVEHHKSRHHKHHHAFHHH
ncbi:DMT family transporter [Candidatus Saccharibacteria bacterium]|nr:DMT family transporter [Candidatus Saccharibacteria bacterium]